MILTPNAGTWTSAKTTPVAREHSVPIYPVAMSVPARPAFGEIHHHWQDVWTWMSAPFHRMENHCVVSMPPASILPEDTFADVRPDSPEIPASPASTLTSVLTHVVQTAFVPILREVTPARAKRDSQAMPHSLPDVLVSLHPFLCMLVTEIFPEKSERFGITSEIIWTW